MTGCGASESVVDRSAFRLEGPGAGPERVSEVERAIVELALLSGDRRRILEVGTGFGRLTPTIARVGEEVVATDLDIDSLAAARPSSRTGRALRVAANPYHLPFVDGAFTGATMVRVRHHLPEPTRALSEIGRVLRGGSRLVVSSAPIPSADIAVTDVRRTSGSPLRGSFQSAGPARGAGPPPPEPLPIRVPGRKQFDREAREPVFEPEREGGTGPQGFAPLRRLPAGIFVRLGTVLGRAPVFPTGFAVVAKKGPPGPALPGFASILACPKCRATRPEWSFSERITCRACAFHGTRRGAVLDLRYVPAGARRWEAGS
jgi:SAM-dependent methyltransferase